MGSADLNALPNELIVEIASYLDERKYITKFRLVSKRIKACCERQFLDTHFSTIHHDATDRSMSTLGVIAGRQDYASAVHTLSIGVYRYTEHWLKYGTGLTGYFWFRSEREE